jgi:hypothetical protein
LGVDIPQPFNSSVSGGISVLGPVQVAGIPDTFHINLDHVPDTLPKVTIGVDPVTLTLNPVDVTIGIDRIPDIRAHLPADFSVGLSLFGFNLLGLRLCGEAQVITEPYRPNPCEHCGRPQIQPRPDVPPS